jgi:glycosyl transferase family 25
MYLNFFSDVYYINLDYRTDRRELFERRALEVGIIPNRLSAFQPLEEDCPLLESSQGETRRRYKVGCTLSHQEVIKIAKQRGLDNVLIFEDDCIFLDGFKEKAQKCVDELKGRDWDILYFGGEPNNICTDVSPNLVTIKDGGVYCCHAYAVNHTFYDKIIKLNPHHVDEIDLFLLNYPTDRRKYILSRELLAVQVGIFSDLKNGLNEAAAGYMRGGWDKYVNK